MAKPRSILRVLPLLIVGLLVLGACQEGGTQRGGLSGSPDGQSLTRQSGETLAHQHSVHVDVEEAAIPGAHQTIVDACTGATDYSCTVLASELAAGKRTTANVRLRVEPKGIEVIHTLVGSLGTITRQSTRVEDLARAIEDTEARIAMLTSERDQLLQIRAGAQNDVDALIKIAAELSRVQSELEKLSGEARFQKLRIETDTMDVSLSAGLSTAFWTPVGEAFDEFSRDLSSGIADAVSGFAHVLPWFVVLLPFLLLLRWIFWRRRRQP